MKIVSQTEYLRKKKHGYVGEWSRQIWEFRLRDFPEDWIGRRTILCLEGGTTCLLTEGVHFIIAMNFDKRETATLLAALRFFEANFSDAE